MKKVGFAVEPFRCQVKVLVSESALLAFAVRVVVPPTPIVVPVAAGVWEAHVGTVFFVIVHVFVAVVNPFVAEAMRVFVAGPSFIAEERTELNALVPEMGVPFRVQLKVQDASFGTATNALAVEGLCGTFSVALEGVADAIAQTGTTFTDQLQEVVS